ncbi:MAG TPA: hypothetical protein VMO26_05305 [Vicinamibacterales bacterium]|nr:hypothetical protein [Vicinamibacterales bacterium]
MRLLGGETNDCREPNLAQKLSALGFTHLLVRRGTIDDEYFATRAEPDGLRAVARFDDGQVFAVTEKMPVLYTAAMAGFEPREHNAEWTWRWIATEAAWTIRNTSERPIVTTLDLELSAFHRARRMDVLLDGTRLQSIVAEPSRRSYRIGPFSVMPGTHQILFDPVDPPTVVADVANSRDRRALSVALGTWNWNAPSGRF